MNVTEDGVFVDTPSKEGKKIKENNWQSGLTGFEQTLKGICLNMLSNIIKKVIHSLNMKPIWR